MSRMVLLGLLLAVSVGAAGYYFAPTCRLTGDRELKGGQMVDVCREYVRPPYGW